MCLHACVFIHKISVCICVLHMPSIHLEFMHLNIYVSPSRKPTPEAKILYTCYRYKWTYLIAVNYRGEQVGYVWTRRPLPIPAVVSHILCKRWIGNYEQHPLIMLKDLFALAAVLYNWTWLSMHGEVDSLVFFNATLCYLAFYRTFKHEKKWTCSRDAFCMAVVQCGSSTGLVTVIIVKYLTLQAINGWVYVAGLLMTMGLYFFFINDHGPV